MIDLDSTHQVLRVTFRKVLTDQLLRKAYRSVARLACTGGPYAGILDLSKVLSIQVSQETIRSLAGEPPAIPGGKIRVVVASSPAYGLARMFELMRDAMGGQFHVVWSMEEACAIVGVGPESFWQRLFFEDLAA